MLKLGLEKLQKLFMGGRIRDHLKLFLTYNIVYHFCNKQIYLTDHVIWDS